MDARVSEVARAALRKLSEPASGQERALPSEFRIGPISLVQLSRLAYLQAGDPLVDQVLEMLKAGRPVYLDRAATEAAIALRDFPPRVQEQFQRWFLRLSNYGIALTGPARPKRTPAEQAASHAPPPVTAGAAFTPDRQILSEILGGAAPEPHPCWLEPQKACCGSGRCKQLGF